MPLLLRSELCEVRNKLPNNALEPSRSCPCWRVATARGSARNVGPLLNLNSCADTIWENHNRVKALEDFRVLVESYFSGT